MAFGTRFEVRARATTRSLDSTLHFVMTASLSLAGWSNGVSAPGVDAVVDATASTGSSRITRATRRRMAWSRRR